MQQPPDPAAATDAGLRLTDADYEALRLVGLDAQRLEDLAVGWSCERVQPMVSRPQCRIFLSYVRDRRGAAVATTGDKPTLVAALCAFFNGGGYTAPLRHKPRDYALPGTERLRLLYEARTPPIPAGEQATFAMRLSVPPQPPDTALLAVLVDPGAPHRPCAEPLVAEVRGRPLPWVHVLPSDGRAPSGMEPLALDLSGVLPRRPAASLVVVVGRGPQPRTQALRLSLEQVRVRPGWRLCPAGALPLVAVGASPRAPRPAALPAADSPRLAPTPMPAPHPPVLRPAPQPAAPALRHWGAHFLVVDMPPEAWAYSAEAHQPTSGGLDADDDDIALERMLFSRRCVLSGRFMSEPCLGPLCRHHGHFSAEGFVLRWEATGMALCPLCERPVTVLWLNRRLQAHLLSVPGASYDPVVYAPAASMPPQ